ncbi:serine kinase/phosphatase [Ralstonia sp. R-29]|uniref:serine kinase/phosphatase n=1 Tax=Ralstonia sp. R-29 TaxID=3404059 RepID=UPI003CF5ED0F
MTPLHRNTFSAAQVRIQPPGEPTLHAATQAQDALQAVVSAGTDDMRNAARLEDALNRTQALAKLMEAGPKAAKDLLA